MILLPFNVYAQAVYPYDKSEHGGRDANGDGTTGAQRPPNQPVAGYTVDPTMFAPGSCTHCHDQHASTKNVSYPPNPRLAFQSPENRLCATCHDRNNSASFNQPWFVGWAGTQRSSFYGQSKHGKSTSGAQWVAGSSYSGIPNVINNNLATPAPPPGASKVYEKGSCLTCHSSHGYHPGITALVTTQEQTNGIISHMLTRTMGSQTGASPAESNALCNYCHDNTTLFGSGSDHSLMSKHYWFKGSQSSANYSGYNATPHKTSTHAYNLWPGNSTYPALTGEKGQCLNCHDPHGGAPAGNLNGAANSSATSNRMLVAPMIDPNQPTTRNTLCFTCHNNISGTGAQRFLGQTLYQASKHGSSAAVYWGRTTDVVDNSATSYNQSTAFWGPRSTGDYGLCLNCHNPHTKTIGTISVNGSTTIPKMLLDTYHNGNSTSVTSYNANNHKLCYDCHSENRLLNSGNTTFSYHDKHVNEEKALCNDCHNPHGYNSAHVMGSPPAGARNLSFNTATVTASDSSATINGVSTRGPVWFYAATVNGREHRNGCLLKCHGEDHAPKYYNPSGGGNPQRVLVTPQPTGSAKTVKISLQFETHIPQTDTVEYAVDSTSSVKQAAVKRDAGQVTRDMGQRHPSSLIPHPSSLSFELSAAGWTPRSSHAVFVRTKDRRPQTTGQPTTGLQGNNRKSVVSGQDWTGTMVSVTPSDAEPICVTYYLDEDCRQPAPTPNGVPVLPRRGTVYVKLHAPNVGGYRLNIDAPGELNDVENEFLRPLSAPALSDAEGTEAVGTWTITESSDTLGRARVTLTTPEGHVVVPSAGAFVFIGEPPRANVFFELSATPDTLDADGKGTASIRAKVTDANGQPLPSRAVDFRRLSGGGSLLPQSPATDSKGEAAALYLAGITAETAEIEVVDRASGASARTYVRLRLSGSVAITLVDAGASVKAMNARLQRRLQSAAERLNITLNAYPRRLPADGVSTANLVAVVTDGRGLPKPGVMLRFEVADYNGQVLAIRPLTDATGRAEAVYVAGKKPGDITLIASEPLSQATGVVCLTLTGSGAAKIVVEATPNVLPADGRSLSHVVVRVSDLLGRPVSGASVQLHTRSGYGILAAGETTTNALGEVLASFRSGPSAGVETIVATVVSPLPESREGNGEWRMETAGDGSLFPVVSHRSPSFPVVPFSAPLSSLLPPSVSSLPSANSLRLPAPVTHILDNLSVSYGRWDEYLALEGPQVENRSLHLKSNSWNVRFKRPIPLGFGGLTFLINTDNNEAEQYGFLTRYTNTLTTLRASGRYYDFLGNFLQSDTQGEDLRSGLTMQGNARSNLLSLTLRPKRLPIINVSRYQAHYHSSTGEDGYDLGFNRFTTSLYYQFGNFLGVQWTNIKATQNQGLRDDTTTNTFRYSNAALTLRRDVGRAIGIDFTLNRTGTRTMNGEVDRVTNQTNSSFQLRLAPSSKFVVTGIRASNDVEDTTFIGQAFNSTTQSVDISYQPARFLSLQAGMRSDDQATLSGVGASQFKTRNVGGMLLLTSHSTLTFNVTHSEEPVILLLQQGQQTDSKSLQLVTTRVLPNTDLLLGWMSLRSTSLSGENNIATYSARIQSELSPNLRASLGFSRSSIAGDNEGLLFALTSRTNDFTLQWMPNKRTEVAYILSRLYQQGGDAMSDSTLSLLRLSTTLRHRASMVVEAANNVLNQSLLLPGGFGQSLKGTRFSARFNYAIDANSYLFIQLEKSQDDISHFRTRSLRMGYTAMF